MLRHAGSYSILLAHSSFTLILNLLAVLFSFLLSFFVFTSQSRATVLPIIPTLVEQDLSWCAKSLSFVYPPFDLFLFRCFHQDPTLKVLRRKPWPPSVTEPSSCQKSYLHLPSILTTFVTSHDLPSGCCRSGPLLCLYSFGPGAIKQSSGQWGVWGYTLWGGQPVS